jgi:hypothetical protein
MLFGLDGVEIGLIIVFLTLFAGIMTGFPVAFAIGGAGVISFAIIAALDSAGLLIHQAIDTSPRRNTPRCWPKGSYEKAYPSSDTRSYRVSRNTCSRAAGNRRWSATSPSSSTA